MLKTFWISLFVAACGLSASSQTTQTINACVNNLNGVPRLVAASTSCINGVETFKQWNVTGPQGPQGPAGAQGQQGFTGSPGGQGPAGPTGNTGLQGAQGAAGAQGALGPKGDTGAQGPAGPAGPSGPTGLKGSTGATGSAGPEGPAGPSGPTGPTGPTGATGPAGGQVYEANLVLPSSTVSGTYLGAASGRDTSSGYYGPADIQTHELVIPTECVAGNFSATQMNGPGSGAAQVYLGITTDPTGYSAFGESIGCSMKATGTSGASAISSCSSSGTITLAAGTAVLIGTLLPGDWGNARFLVRFTCN
jgi:hypothetical protein